MKLTSYLRGKRHKQVMTLCGKHSDRNILFSGSIEHGEEVFPGGGNAHLKAEEELKGRGFQTEQTACLGGVRNRCYGSVVAERKPEEIWRQITEIPVNEKFGLHPKWEGGKREPLEGS